MLSLPNDCYCSDPKVYPKNWKQPSASVRNYWYIWYRFYDPSIQDEAGNIKPKLVQVKGMNEYKTVSERRLFTKKLLEQETHNLQVEGYNPWTGEYANGGQVSSRMILTEALEYALKQVNVEPSTRADIKSVVKYVKQSAEEIKLASLQINQISRKHILRILEQCKLKNKRWSDNLFNHYRKYLSILFMQLVEVEVIDMNPIRDLSKRKTINRIRITLDNDQRGALDEYLQDNYPAFRRFVHVFFHSGSRISELVCLQLQDVDMEKQRFKITIKKGKHLREVWKTIKDIALPYWQEIISEAQPGDYIFSINLLPGRKKIPAKQITRRWRKHVKEKIGIEADLYSLKHLNSTDMMDFMTAQEVAEMNSHTSTTMVVNIYDVNNARRENDRIRKANNSFVV